MELFVSDDADSPHPKARPGRRALRRRPRAFTVALKQMRGDHAAARLGVDDVFVTRAERIAFEAERPRTREECRESMRPCPYVACKHHLYLDVNPETGSIKINFPDLEPWELEHTCSLDLAARGGMTLEEVGEITNLARERIRQVEVRGLMAMKAKAVDAGMDGSDAVFPHPVGNEHPDAQRSTSEYSEFRRISDARGSHQSTEPKDDKK